MGSNERDETPKHHISSLVVRPSGSNDGEDDRNADAGEDSRDRPSFARSDRHKSDNGAPPRGGRDFSSRRESSGRYRDYSPPHARVSRRFDGLDEPTTHGRPFRSDVVGRNNNNSKVQPRDGDWYCLDPLCRNLNFARREVCFKCKRGRYAPADDSPPPPPPINLSPRRDFNVHSSPPRSYYPRRDYPPPRLDHPTWRDRDREGGDRLRYSNLEYPPNRRLASDWVPEPPHYERRPPLSPPRGGGWGRHSRERSRSPPLRGSDYPPPPVRDYRRNSYFERGGRDDQRGGDRDRMRNAY